MMIEKDCELYQAISKAIDDIFNCDIDLNDPTKTTEQFVEKVNGYMKDE